MLVQSEDRLCKSPLSQWWVSPGSNPGPVRAQAPLAMQKDPAVLPRSRTGFPCHTPDTSQHDKQPSGTLATASGHMLGRGRVSVLLSRSITRSPDRTDRAMEKVREEGAWKIYIPLAQVGPSQPGGHWHSNPVETSWHVPPFAQGLDTQACSAAKTQL